MKRYIRSDLEGSALADYIEKVKRTADLDLDDLVVNHTWDMADDVVSLTVTFVDGSGTTFKFKNTDFLMNPWYYSYDADSIVRRVQNFMKRHRIADINDSYSEWNELDRKSVMDSDGFWTDYTMYVNDDGDRYVFIFGDKDYYTPENSEPDWECETEAEAREWFDDYQGFEVEEDEEIEQGYFDDIESSTSLSDKFREIHDKDEINWQMHDYNYEPFYDELKSYMVDGETWDAEDADGWSADTNVELDTLFNRMPADKQKDFMQRFWVHDPDETILSYWSVEDQIDAPDTIGSLNPGDVFINRNGVKITIVEPTKDGRIQYNVGDECHIGSEKSIQQMLYRNNYIRNAE